MNKKYFIKSLVFTTILILTTACSSAIDEDDSTTSSPPSSVNNNDNNTVNNNNTVNDPDNQFTTSTTNNLSIYENSVNIITMFSDSNVPLNVALSGSDGDKFMINGSSLVFKTAPDFEEDKVKYYVTALVTNSDKTVTEQKFIIAILDKNDNYPIFENDNNISVKENKTTVMELEAIDADDNNDIEYSIKENNNDDADSFELNDNEISFIDAPDFEIKSVYIFTAIADDGLHKTEETIKVNIIDVADVVPIIENKKMIISEDIENNSSIGNIDIITIGDTNISSFLLSGDGNESFSISLEGNISVSSDAILDYDRGFKKYSFSLIAVNEAGDSNASDLNITIRDVIDEVPILLNLDASIIENATKMDFVGQIQKEYEGDSYISKIVLNGDGSDIFSVDNKGFISIDKEYILDYETTQNYYLTAIATNDAGDSQAIDVNISVNDYLNKPFQIAKIVDIQTDTNDAFGYATAMDGDYIVIGAYKEDTTAIDAGSAYIYKKYSDGTFFQVDRIQASDAGEENYFAKSLAISQSYIVVGSPNDGSEGNSAGSAYIFQRKSDSSVEEISKITADDIEAGDYFGNAVAIDNNYIAISAYQEDETEENAGSVYIFKINSDNSVVQIAKVQADYPKKDDYFGTSISLSRNYIVVGTPYQDTTADNAGTVYIFKIESDDTVNQIAKIQAKDAGEADYFGRSVSIDDDYILIGADGEDTTTNNAGSAYLFKKYSDDKIEQIAKIQADDVSDEGNAGFGSNVSIDKDYMLISSKIGSSYTFKRESDDENNVTQVTKDYAFDGESEDGFGTSISISGDYMVVGAYKDDSRAVNTQSVYLFYMEPLLKPYVYNSINEISYDEQFSKTYIDTFQSATPSGGTVNFSVTQNDASSFNFSENRFDFNQKVDYENPEDEDSNNKYEVTIVAEDENNQQFDFSLEIEVNDRKYLDLATLYASDKEVTDDFANAVSMSGDYIVFSSYKKDSDSGKAYLYKKDSEGIVTEVAKFQADDIEEGEMFGVSLSINGNYIAVGASKKNSATDEEGIAYLFKIASDDTVSQIAKFQADDAEDYDHFGTSISLSGNYIAVGSPNDDTSATNTGSAYIFKRNSDDDNNVTQIAKITADDAEERELFGTAISIDGDYIVVGAKDENTTADNAGSAYLFKRLSDDEDNVTQIAKVQASDAEENDYFGSSVSINGDYFIVGAIGEDTTADNAGSAYLFKRNSDDEDNVTQIAKLQADDAKTQDSFGYSVSIDGDNIVVGAKYEDIKNSKTIIDSGAVYVYRRNSDDTIQQIEKLKAENAQDGDSFGVGVSISGNFIAVGASKHDDMGSAYIFIKDDN